MRKNATFIDGEERHKQHPKTFPLPTKKQKKTLQVDDWVKVGLGGYPTKEPITGERFWVALTAIKGSQLSGKVINDLVFTKDHGVDRGDILTFEMRNVIDIDPADNNDPEAGNDLPEIAREFLKE